MNEFIDYFREKDQWIPYIEDASSMLNKLLPLFCMEDELNLTNLKYFALLMCPGSPKEKAGHLYDVIQPKEGMSIAWKNPKLY